MDERVQNFMLRRGDARTAESLKNTFIEKLKTCSRDVA